MNVYYWKRVKAKCWLVAKSVNLSLTSEKARPNSFKLGSGALCLESHGLRIKRTQCECADAVDSPLYLNEPSLSVEEQQPFNLNTLQMR